MKDKILAQIINISGTPIKGPLPEDTTINSLITKMLDFLYPLAAIILFFFLVWGGFTFMTSQGDPEKMKSARAKITSAIIGFVLLLLSYIIAKGFSLIFGIGEGIF